MEVVLLHSVRPKLHLFSLKDLKREEIPFPVSRTRGRAPQPGGKVIPIKEPLTIPLRGTNAQLSECLSSQKALAHTHARTHPGAPFADVEGCFSLLLVDLLR